MAAEVESVAGKHELASIEDVKEGDLVFGYKRSPMQWMMLQVGDPWRHVGVVAKVEGGVPVVGEVTGAHRFGSRPIDKVLSFYDAVGLARRAPAPGHCTEAVVGWIASQLEDDQLYAWDDVLLTGIVLMTRKRMSRLDMAKLTAALEEVAGYHPPPRRPSMTCSAFVFRAFDQHQGCRLDIDLRNVGSTPDRRFRSSAADAPGRTGATEFDQLETSSLWEVARPTGGRSDSPTMRGHRRSHASVAQLLKAGSLVASLVEQYSKDYEATGADSVDRTDGRWVSPGDIWRSPSLTGHRYLKLTPGSEAV